MSTLAELALGIKTDSFKAGSTFVKNELRSISNIAGATARKVRNIGLGLTAGITVPITLASKSAIEAASSAEETASKFDAVFDTIVKGSNEVADAFAKDFRLASSTSRELLSATGDILVGFGFTEQAALDLSNTTNRLAADLASFTNMQGGTARASQALTKLLVGETEQAKALGIVVRQNSDEYKGLVKEIMSTQGATLLQAKALAGLEIATRQTQKAQGDFARTMNSPANLMRFAAETAKTLREEFGAMLIDGLNVRAMLTRLAEGFKSATAFLRSLSPEARRLIVILVGVAAAVGPVLLILGTVGLAVAGIVAGISALIGAAPFIAIAVVAIAGIALQLGAVIGVLKVLGVNFGEVFSSIGGWLKQAGSNVIGFLMNFRENWALIIQWLKDTWMILLSRDLPTAMAIFARNILSNMKVLLNGVGGLIGAVGAWILDNWKGWLTDFFNEAVRWAAKFIVFVQEFASNAIVALKAGLSGKEIQLDLLGSLMEGAAAAGPLKDRLQSVLDRVKKDLRSPLEGFTSQALKSFPELALTWKTAAKEVAEASKDAKAAATTATQTTEGRRSFAAAIQKGTIEAYQLTLDQGSTVERETEKNTAKTAKNTDIIARGIGEMVRSGGTIIAAPIGATG